MTDAATALPRCPCGAEAVAIAPGSDGEYTVLGDTRIYTVRPAADVVLCLACVQAAGGWPWPSERRRG